MRNIIMRLYREDKNVVNSDVILLERMEAFVNERDRAIYE